MKSNNEKTNFIARGMEQFSILFANGIIKCIWLEFGGKNTAQYVAAVKCLLRNSTSR